MLLKGMDCARINCAHDNANEWLKMVKNIEKACAETNKKCKVLMDLAGPKLRTSDISSELSVLKIKPKKNNFGHVVSPAKIFIHSADKNISCVDKSFTLPIKGDWLKEASIGDVIVFKDARKSNREIKLFERNDDGFWGELFQTTYITPNTELKLLMACKHNQSKYLAKVGKVGKLPNLQKMIFVHKGDFLILNKKNLPGKPAEYSENGQLTTNASISCSLPEIFSMVAEGERILFDDGRIGGVIKEVNKEEILIEITEIADNGDKLLADKGINLPDSNLTLDAITEADLKNLKFVVKHADMVGFSFSKNTKDVEIFQKHLKELAAENLVVVLKVETRSAFEKLPQMLLSLMQSPKVAIMIARGDLAVECGYERLAELQEEILCLAEAAHIPVIWATQVLENLAKTGKPSRAEISDAVMAERAECVMLNKGAHILDAIEMLVNILKRMQGFQRKKHLY
jgi:pyruvate kinase